MILMISGATLSYLIPSFGHDSRFIRINGPEWNVNTWAFQSCAADKLFALTSSAEDVAELRDLLARYGLAEGDLSACITVTSKIGSARLCPLVRAATETKQ